MASLIREAVARAHDFLLEPAPAASEQRHRIRSTEVAVLGLSAGCGVTTLARGLALMLDVPGERPAQVLSVGEGAGDEVVPLAGASAVVWDVDSSAAASELRVAQRADAVVLVAGKSCEPALAEITAGMLREDLPRVVVAANRIADPSQWSGRADLCVPESWLGAALLGRGRRPPGALRAALARLAVIVQGEPAEG